MEEWRKHIQGLFARFGIPSYFWQGLEGYILNGLPYLTDFTYAVFSNDLMEAMRRADDINRDGLRGWCALLEQLPLGCWGSEEKIKAWMSHRGLSGLLEDLGHPSITCPRCGKTSYNPGDIENSYCRDCGFHDDMAEGDVDRD